MAEATAPIAFGDGVELLLSNNFSVAENRFQKVRMKLVDLFCE
jgi:hypothetical protein